MKIDPAHSGQVNFQKIPISSAVLSKPAVEGGGKESEPTIKYHVSSLVGATMAPQ